MGAEFFDLAAITAENRLIEGIEREMLKGPQGECPLNHTFSPGIYLRTITMQKGLFIIGHEHLTEHLNIVHSGLATVRILGGVQEVRGPHVFNSLPGVRKVLYIRETMQWSTVHANSDNCRDIPTLELRLIRKSQPFIEHEKAMIELKYLAMRMAA